jgi:hypothetical protein
VDNETINRHIHEKVFGKCWHEWPLDPADMPTMPCDKCGERSLTWPETNPDYCSKKSPRELLEEAVDKAVEMVGMGKYARHLIQVRNGDDDIYEDDGLTRWKPFDLGYLAAASAQQIATAIYHATKEEGK